MKAPTPKIIAVRHVSGPGRRRPMHAECLLEAPIGVAKLSRFALLVRRVRGWRKAGLDGLAPRAVRLKRQAICQPGVCISAKAVPGSTWCRCSMKGCGCDDLHAARAKAKCPRGFWPA